MLFRSKKIRATDQELLDRLSRRIPAEQIVAATEAIRRLRHELKNTREEFSK